MPRHPNDSRHFPYASKQARHIADRIDCLMQKVNKCYDGTMRRDRFCCNIRCGVVLHCDRCARSGLSPDWPVRLGSLSVRTGSHRRVCVACRPALLAIAAAISIVNPEPLGLATRALRNNVSYPVSSGINRFQSQLILAGPAFCHSRRHLRRVFLDRRAPQSSPSRR